MTETEIPAQVNGTSQDSEEAPYGWTKDRKTGELRPKKKPGPPRAAAGAPPGLEELRASGPLESAGPPADRVPGSVRRGRRRRSLRDRIAAPPPEDLPPFRAGPIAKSLNRLYRRIGKILKQMDRDLGVAVIACTKKEDEDDITVGEAWEALAKNNPRIRAFLMSITTTGDWTALFMAHAPILGAVLMKEGIRKHLPLQGLIEAFLDHEGEEDDAEEDQDEDGAPVPAGMPAAFAALTPQDMAMMQGMANKMMAGFASKMPRGPANGRAPVVDDPPGGQEDTG